MHELFNYTNNDPLKRYVEKESGEELSPMDPPNAFQPPSMDAIPYEKLHPLLQLLINEHKVGLKQIENFEITLQKLQQGESISEIETGLRDFFSFFDNKIVVHNLKEEKVLFPAINKKLIEKGEHSNAKFPKTAIDLMEDDHSKFLQTAAVCFNFLGLAVRLPDNTSRMLVLDAAIEQGKSLIEILRLHIFREDNIIFTLAQNYLDEDELNALLPEIKKYLDY